MKHTNGSRSKVLVLNHDAAGDMYDIIIRLSSSSKFKVLVVHSALFAKALLSIRRRVSIAMDNVCNPFLMQ